MATRRAFILAGTGSGCGKTTVTLGLLSLLQQRGMRVQPCKVGPDYLDTAWHTAISGIASRNLDSFMLPAPILNALFTEQLQQADIAVIEGVMGLYDGYGTDPNYCSSAAMAKQLGCPVILLVDGKAVSTSIAATVMGFQHFDPALDIAGVIVNRVNSDAHFQLLKSAIERYCRVPVLGYVPRVEGVALPERHLGLVTARESVVNQQAWRDFASLLGRTLDIDRLLALSELAAMPIGEWGEQLAADAGEGLTLALADDEAFNFYYPDNLALLARCGVKMVRFSPLRDRQLPACQMIWLGGGYPELHAAGLSANHEMLTQLRAAHRRGVAIYAECGGLMYLAKPSCGFLLGLPLMAMVIGLLTRDLKASTLRGHAVRGMLRIALACVAGLAVLYLIGLPYMYFVLAGKWSIQKTIVSGCLIFLPFDALKIVVTTLLCVRLLPVLRRD